MDTGVMLEHDWFPRPLPANVVVSDRSWIYSTFAFVHYVATHPRAVCIGKDSGIYNGTFFDLGSNAVIEIGSFCALVGAIIRTNGRVAIGDYSFIAHEVVIADDAYALPPPPNTRRHLPRSADGELTQSSPAEVPRQPGADSRPAPIILGENCWVGMGAVLLAGTDLGEGCVVGAAAVVDFPAPPYSIIAGNPARIVGTSR